MKELDLMPLDEDQLASAGGGCSGCHYELNPPGSLDAFRVQGHGQIVNDMPVDLPTYFSM